MSIPPEVFAAQPGKWEGSGWAVLECTFCRKGDVFYPVLDEISGAAPGTSNGLKAFTPEHLRLFANGTELPQEEHFFYGPTYRLPPEATDYRLIGESATAETTWTFRSARGSQDHAPQGFACPEWWSSPDGGCQFEPMLFLRYRMNTDPHNAVPERSRQTLVVSAYRALGQAPQVRDMQAFVSTDSGTTWQDVRLRALGGGEFAAGLRIPAYDATDGTLALKVTATAEDGSTIQQTIREAVSIQRESGSMSRTATG
ncbi:hypothetical protein [Nocardioides sp. T2.26MG-1]|uniref:hypothetical protein n=1 Tax=Nocardioides sp. T2.26MG-1 TaxID=3041166 RepID=UPI0025401405|nr:hypothetical protein [Nocardioides sp. T2.26MG-1]